MKTSDLYCKSPERPWLRMGDLLFIDRLSATYLIASHADGFAVAVNLESGRRLTVAVRVASTSRLTANEAQVLVGGYDFKVVRWYV